MALASPAGQTLWRGFGGQAHHWTGGPAAGLCLASLAQAGKRAGLLIQEESCFFEWEHQEEQWREAGRCQNMGTVILGWVQPATPVGKAEAGRCGQPCRGTQPEQVKVGKRAGAEPKSHPGGKQAVAVCPPAPHLPDSDLAQKIWAAFTHRSSSPANTWGTSPLSTVVSVPQRGGRWFLKEEREGARGNPRQCGRPPSSPRAKLGCPCSTEHSCSSVRAGVGKRLPAGLAQVLQPRMVPSGSQFINFLSGVGQVGSRRKVVSTLRCWVDIAGERLPAGWSKTAPEQVRCPKDLGPLLWPGTLPSLWPFPPEVSRCCTGPITATKRALWDCSLAKLQVWSYKDQSHTTLAFPVTLHGSRSWTRRCWSFCTLALEKTLEKRVNSQENKRMDLQTKPLEEPRTRLHSGYTV